MRRPLKSAQREREDELVCSIISFNSERTSETDVLEFSGKKSWAGRNEIQRSQKGREIIWLPKEESHLNQ